MIDDGRERRRRIAELQAKSRLSDEEMQELIDLTGTFVKGPNAYEMGVADLSLAMENFAMLQRREEEARAAGFLLEAVAVRAYLLEFWLLWWTVQRGEEPVDPEDRATLGSLIQAAAAHSLDPSLVLRLRRFNDARVLAIHRLLRGQLGYAELEESLAEDESLVEQLRFWTASHSPKA